MRAKSSASAPPAPATIESTALQRSYCSLPSSASRSDCSSLIISCAAFGSCQNSGRFIACSICAMRCVLSCSVMNDVQDTTNNEIYNKNPSEVDKGDNKFGEFRDGYNRNEKLCVPGAGLEGRAETHRHFVVRHHDRIHADRKSVCRERV